MLPTDVLKEEHKVILSALKILKNFVDELDNGKSISLDDIKSIIEFFRQFADKCHHGKEEDILFIELEKTGILKDGGPIGQMLIEHTEGREYVKGMFEAFSTETFDKKKFIINAIKYIDLLSSHIEKEDNILYPMGDRVLSNEKQTEILQRFEKFEKEVTKEGVHEKFHHFIKQLEKKYERY